MNRRRSKPAIAAWRLRALLGLFAFAALTLEVRLIWLQLFEGEFLLAAGAERQLRSVEVSAHRGIIRDRNGEELAVSTPVDSIFVNPKVMPLDRERIHALAQAIGRDEDTVASEIVGASDQDFLWLKRYMPPADAFRVLDLGIEGVSAQREYKRFYPHAEVTCHLVGFAGDADVGQEGLELVYDTRLAGQSGRKRVQTDLRGRVIADVEQIEPARPGRDIRISIDSRLQYGAYLALKSAVTASAASSGSVVLLDAQTGEVLAMVNQPFCNPNDPAQRSDPARFRNRAITDPIEPGSTIKPLVLASALGAGGYTPDTLLDVPRLLEIDGRRLTSDPSLLGIASVTEILARSSSVGMGMIGAELDSEDVWRTLRSFGIGGPTDSGLGPLESHGLFADDYSRWSRITKATLSYGYGLSVTPLQLARAYAAIASGGLLAPVSFEALSAPPARKRVLSPELASDLLAMLEVVVSAEGTASRADIPGYRVAGKTGTAEIAEDGRYSDDKRRAIFAGIAPASRPRFVAVVVVNDPRSQAYHGGDVAAPIFAKVMGTALRTYGVPRDDEPEPILLSSFGVPR